MAKSKSLIPVFAAVILACALWFVMFSPWTASRVNFWYTMAGAGLLLTGIATVWGGWFKEIHFNLRSILCGIAIALVLWFVFFLGDKISSLLFGFAGGQVDSIYAMKGGVSPYVIGALLFFIIGPAEEIFWRGFVQKSFSEEWGANWGFAAALLCYTLIHIWSFNFMLIMAALVAGFCWGLIYRLFPRSLTALIISHALWDLCAFILIPMH